MKKPFFVLLIFLLGLLNLYSQENHFVGARSLALSNAYISVSDIWSSFHNQAGLTEVKSFSAGIFYESRFLVDELSLTAGIFILPLRTGTFGLSFYQFGQGAFKENKIGFAFAKELSKTLNAGLQFDYFSNRFPENSKRFGFATFEAGLIYSPKENLFLGVHIFNPIAGGIETPEGKQKSPTLFRLGGHYQFDEMILVIIETQKDLENPFLVKTGIEFSPMEYLSFRFGISGKPVNYTAGLGYTFGKITTDIGFSYHGTLGLTPSISLQYKL